MSIPHAHTHLNAAQVCCLDSVLEMDTGRRVIGQIKRVLAFKLNA